MRTALLPALLLASAPAFAVDFGVMETADVVETGRFKFAAHPMAVREGAQDAGVALGAGYGFRPGFDAELQVSAYDDVTFFGGDLEYTLYDDYNVELSIGSGAHYGDTDFGNVRGLDLTHIASYKLPAAPRVKLNGGFDAAYEDADAQYARANGTDDEYFTAHFVPGVQFSATRNLDFITEVGLALNSEASEYVAAGLSFYFDRRY